MTEKDFPLEEGFVRLALSINEYLPGYVDSYFGPAEWTQEAKQVGKLPLPNLTHIADQLATDVLQMSDWEAQRKDFLARHIQAMQMSLRLLGGEQVSLAEEVQALYDVQPKWQDESIFVEAQKVLDQIRPKAGSLKERLERWNQSLEIPIEKVRELLPIISNRLRELTGEKFGLPDGESFTVEFISEQPWLAYNWYLGGYRSRIDINLDLPIQVNGLLNSPACVITEGIATTALKTVLPDNELEDWYRSELLPCVGRTEIDAAMIIEVDRAEKKMKGLGGNAAFMLYDQNQSREEIKAYLQKYGLMTEQEANHLISSFRIPLIVLTFLPIVQGMICWKNCLLIKIATNTLEGY